MGPSQRSLVELMNMLNIKESKPINMDSQSPSVEEKKSFVRGEVSINEDKSIMQDLKSKVSLMDEGQKNGCIGFSKKSKLENHNES